jgi:hypothetical protein
MCCQTHVFTLVSRHACRFLHLWVPRASNWSFVALSGPSGVEFGFLLHGWCVSHWIHPLFVRLGGSGVAFVMFTTIRCLLLPRLYFWYYYSYYCWTIAALQYYYYFTPTSVALLLLILLAVLLPLFASLVHSGSNATCFALVHQLGVFLLTLHATWTPSSWIYDVIMSMIWCRYAMRSAVTWCRTMPSTISRDDEPRHIPCVLARVL